MSEREGEKEREPPLLSAPRVVTLPERERERDRERERERDRESESERDVTSESIQYPRPRSWPDGSWFRVQEYMVSGSGV